MQCAYAVAMHAGRASMIVSTRSGNRFCLRHCLLTAWLPWNVPYNVGGCPQDTQRLPLCIRPLLLLRVLRPPQILTARNQNPKPVGRPHTCRGRAQRSPTGRIFWAPPETCAPHKRSRHNQIKLKKAQKGPIRWPIRSPIRGPTRGPVRGPIRWSIRGPTMGPNNRPIGGPIGDVARQPCRQQAMAQTKCVTTFGVDDHRGSSRMHGKGICTPHSPLSPHSLQPHPVPPTLGGGGLTLEAGGYKAGGGYTFA